MHQPNWTRNDMARIQNGLERIAELGTNAFGSLSAESLAMCEAIARDLLNHQHGVWQHAVGKPREYQSPYART